MLRHISFHSCLKRGLKSKPVCKVLGNGRNESLQSYVLVLGSSGRGVSKSTSSIAQGCPGSQTPSSPTVGKASGCDSAISAVGLLSGHLPSREVCSASPVGFYHPRLSGHSGIARGSPLEHTLRNTWQTSGEPRPSRRSRNACPRTHC